MVNRLCGGQSGGGSSLNMSNAKHCFKNTENGEKYMTAERSEFANSGNTGNISIAIDGPAGAGKSTIAKEISEEVSHYASVISTIPEVRKKLVELQRALARVRNVVMDGRDICSYVLPDATHKFFVTAEPEVRAARRYAEYAAAGKLNGRSFDDILCEIKRRDERDSTREAAPLRPADDAVVIDTSEMNVESAVAAVLAHIG